MDSQHLFETAILVVTSYKEKVADLERLVKEREETIKDLRAEADMWQDNALTEGHRVETIKRELEKAHNKSSIVHAGAENRWRQGAAMGKIVLTENLLNMIKKWEDEDATANPEPVKPQCFCGKDATHEVVGVDDCQRHILLYCDDCLTGMRGHFFCSKCDCSVGYYPRSGRWSHSVVSQETLGHKANVSWVIEVRCI